LIHLNELMELTGSESMNTTSESQFQRVVINSSDAQPGDLFVALHGQRDGHEFVGDAVAKGATAVLVDRDVDASVTTIRVPDTLTALHELARGRRQRSRAKVVGITGSVGKTTTKDLVHHALQQEAPVLASAKSYNNHIGVPLTLIQLSPETREAVCEVGTNHPGEIQPLAHLVQPDVGIVTQVGFAHIGNFSSQSALADEKVSLLAEVSDSGFWIINGDDQVLTAAVNRLGAQRKIDVVRVGFGAHNDVRVTDLKLGRSNTRGILRIDGAQYPFQLPMVGRHFGYTAMFAAATANALGHDVERAIRSLSTFTPSSGRARIIDASDGLRIIDDTYNGSPDSMLASLDTLKSTESTNRIAILGEMRELGNESDRLHARVGLRAGESATHLIVIGEGARSLVEAAITNGLPPNRIQRAMSAKDAGRIALALVDELEGHTSILVKGSRFIHTERATLILASTADVLCDRVVCPLYINCAECDMLKVGPE